ncbi:gliding-motility protein MglA [candidate division KSB3 bacterium]|uniref:Gliding-motility protein MglA n=1 Tax=candidate division KSB3 bacterium TaxID=2044937 RepID=A0A2G6KB83_9BACT|nr:MAG: gliding-motility protein MglA [candidate division KSB3 bacterium]
MAQFNYNTREIIAKVVYYGPSVGGKTTNLQWLHNKLDPRSVGKLFSLETEADRTLFFDLLPINLGNIKGMDLRLKVYTVPGQVKYNSTRKMVLTGADAVAFVADSDVKRHKENVESLKNLAENLAANGLNIRTIPLVLQYNKRDIPNVLPIEVMDKKLNFRGLPSFGSIAIDPNDQGVLNCFIAVLVAMVESFGEKYKIGKSSDEIKRITEKLEKNLREHVERSETGKTGKKQREEEEPGKFVIKPTLPRDQSLNF